MTISIDVIFHVLYHRRNSRHKKEILIDRLLKDNSKCNNTARKTLVYSYILIDECFTENQQGKCECRK